MFPQQKCVGLLWFSGGLWNWKQKSAETSSGITLIPTTTKICQDIYERNINHPKKHTANQCNVTTWGKHIPSREFSRSSTLSSAREISSARNRSPLCIASIKGPSTHSNNLEGSTFCKQTKLFTTYSDIYGRTNVTSVSLLTQNPNCKIFLCLRKSGNFKFL